MHQFDAIDRAIASFMRRWGPLMLRHSLAVIFHLVWAAQTAGTFAG
jgi:hypothetical protein